MVSKYFVAIMLFLSIDFIICDDNEERIKALEATHRRQEEKNRMLDRAIYSLREELRLCRQETANIDRIKRTNQESLVAFSVRASQRISNLGRHQTIVFDRIVENIGSYYNAGDGIFFVPVSGVYVFTWTIATTDSRYLSSELVKNGHVFGYSYTDSESIHDFASASNTVVLTVTRGDHVYIRTGTEGKDTLDSQKQSCTFSGWLISSAP